ncbi:hypothetical protein TKK_0003624 [Trichogramma kaykai]
MLDEVQFTLITSASKPSSSQKDEEKVNTTDVYKDDHKAEAVIKNEIHAVYIKLDKKQKRPDDDNDDVENREWTAAVRAETAEVQRRTPVDSVPPDERFYFRHVQLSEEVEAVARTRTEARGTDDMPASFLRECLCVTLPVMANIFYCSLQTDVFPSAWKTAIVRTVPKKSSPRDAGDFRPISLLWPTTSNPETSLTSTSLVFVRAIARRLPFCA